MPLLLDFLPAEPPAIVAMVTAEAVSSDDSVAKVLSEELAEYARRLKQCLQWVVESAKAGRLDVAAILFEVYNLEKAKLASSGRKAKVAHDCQRIVVKWKKRAKLPALPAATRAKYLAGLKASEIRLGKVQEISKVDRQAYLAFKQCRTSLQTIRKARLKEYRAEFEAFVRALPQGPGKVTALWAWSALEKVLPAPECSISEDGDILFVWDNGPHHIQFEALASGHYDWFYRNRETGTTAGEEGLSLQVMPAELTALAKDLGQWP